MKTFLTFVFSAIFCLFNASAAVRDTNTISRNQTKSVTKTHNTRSISNRSAVKKVVSARTSGSVTTLKPRTSATQTVATRVSVNNRNANKGQRNTTINKQNVSVRAATQTSNTEINETRTGAEYEQCKTAFFTCMDQFCQLKNDNFRRCSCSDKIFEYKDTTEKYQDVGVQLTEFAENLDIVGMTKEQATAMKTATEGEDALTEDKSSSKQLLQAIMNAIKGEDSSVGGKYQKLNTIAPMTDISNTFGMSDYGQTIASYNGVNLYKAVYPQCRKAVKDDCNDAALQRAVNAYLMAIEQDCNTVESALSNQQKALKTTTYESSAMLDLARIENRKKHNSSDIAKCITNIETSIQSEEVCGAGYYKCLDNGQYIDVTTGEPLTGVQDFYKLGELLTFTPDKNIQNQKLSEILENRTFITFFENKTKKFAKDALDKCTEKSADVWQQYLDRALLDIYYAQQSKVKDIRDNCVKLISACYHEQKAALEGGLENLDIDYSIYLSGSVENLSQQMCDNYITSCNNMFAGNVIKQYIESTKQSNLDNICRTVAQNCFDDFGGTNYENFYYLPNGVISPNTAIDWFTLYDHTGSNTTTILSPCAQALANTEGCNTPEILEHVFGGFDKYPYQDGGNDNIKYTYCTNCLDQTASVNNLLVKQADDRHARPTGIATEIYDKIIETLSTQCDQLHGYFVQTRYTKSYGYKSDNSCQVDINTHDSPFYTPTSFPPGNYPNLLSAYYHFLPNEDMCPLGYASTIDTQSWGICSCWENGNYRSKNGTNPVCLPVLPILINNLAEPPVDNIECTEDMLLGDGGTGNPMKYHYTDYYPYLWCHHSVESSRGQICPTLKSTQDSDSVCCTYPNAIAVCIQSIKDQTLHNRQD